MTGRALSFETPDGLRLRAGGWGEAAMPAVLFAHGGGQTRHAWGAAARAVAAAGRYVVSLDLRGHGDSDWAADGNYTIDAFAGDIRCVARSLGGRPALVGASLGGLAALLAAGESAAPLCSTLVLVDVTPRLEQQGVDRVVGFMRARLGDGFASLEEAADAIAAYLPHRPRPADPKGLAKVLRRGEDGRFRWHWDPRLVAVDARSPARLDPARLAAAARRLAVPTLLVRGQASELVSDRAVREFLALVPHADYVDVSGAGHMVAGDRNDAFTAAVLAFLSQTRRAPAPRPRADTPTA